VSQIKRVNAACKLLALLKSDDSDLQAANASSHFLFMLSLGGQSVVLGPRVCSLWAEGVLYVNRIIVTENHNVYTVLVRQLVIWIRNNASLCSTMRLCHAVIWVICDSYEQAQKMLAVNGQYIFLGVCGNITCLLSESEVTIKDCN
jgi:hypothetical protein